MNDRQQVNFTIVPDDGGNNQRVYANFCTIAHTPFDFTLTFCEVMPPPAEVEVPTSGAEPVLRAPVRARLAVPIHFLPTFVAALQEHMRLFAETDAAPPGFGSPVH